MSIPEAARLVIQAGALGKGGDVFLLEMGNPVSIFDLAVQMIELSGLTLGKDIDIDIIGLRPGEKLYEELLIDINRASKTSHPKIFSANEKSYDWNTLSEHLNSLFEVAKNGNSGEIIKQLRVIVPEYQPDNNSNPAQNNETRTKTAKVTPISLDAS